MGRVSEIVKHLIIINVIFFIASIVFGELMYDLFAMHYPNNPDFILWQPSLLICSCTVILLISCLICLGFGCLELL